MADYSPSEIVDLIIEYGRSNENARECARQYALRYPDRRCPSHVTIISLINRAREGKLHRKRKKKSLTDDNDLNVAVLGMAVINPQTSQRRISRELNTTSRSTVQRILKANHFHAYHIHLHQAFTANQKRERVQFCHWGLEKLQEDPTFFDKVLFSDESTFQNTGELNRHNSHYYSVVNPLRIRHVDHQHQWKLNVWCGILDDQIIGPRFFEDNLNREMYLQFLQNDLNELLENTSLRTRERMWFQHDGASPHRANIVRDYLHQTYPERWIGFNGYVRWPPNSPDLTPCDFFLWGHIKEIVFDTEPMNPVDMRNRITRALATIPEEVLQKTTDIALRKRFQMCIEVNGDTFEQMF